VCSLGRLVGTEGEARSLSRGHVWWSHRPGNLYLIDGYALVSLGQIRRDALIVVQPRTGVKQYTEEELKVLSSIDLELERQVSRPSPLPCRSRSRGRTSSMAFFGDVTMVLMGVGLMLMQAQGASLAQLAEAGEGSGSIEVITGQNQAR
jgi:hypothetical protein